MQYTLEGFEAPPELTSEEEKSNQQLQTKIREILIEFQYVEDSKTSSPKTFLSMPDTLAASNIADS